MSVQESQTNAKPPRWQRFFNIRTKIIVPYLTITIFVAAIGTYIVTRLVAGSLQERLSNQLLESSRVATESVVRREEAHLETIRLVSLASGMDIALAEGDTEFLTLVLGGATENAGIDGGAILDAEGEPLVERGAFEESDLSYGQLAAVQAVLQGQRDAQGDKFADIYYDNDPPLFYVTAPIMSASEPDTLLGVALVGSPLFDVLAGVKQESLADVIAYNSAGEIVGTTFFLRPPEQEALSLDASAVQNALNRLGQEGRTDSFEHELNERRYQGVYAPLRVRGEVSGLIAVFLPSDFIVLEGGTSARIFAVIFGLAAASIIVIGVIIAARIVNPVQRLVQVSQDVTAGDLSRRVQLRGTDEIAYLGSTFDTMTERLQERTLALQAEAARLSSILRATETGMVMIDPQSRLSFINSAARKLLEPAYTPNDEMRMVDFLCSAPEDVPLEINHYILHLNRVQVQSPSEEEIGTLVALQDITQQEMAGRLKDRFIGQVSHEFRTPLTGLIGYNNLVMHRTEHNQVPKLDHVVEVERHANRLNRMISEAIAISRMNTGEFSVIPQPILLQDVLKKALHTKQGELASTLQEMELTFDLQIPEQPASMMGDAERLQWAVEHLIDNAIKYSLPGGIITLRLQSQGQEHQLMVRDTGTGIRPADQPLIFEPYVRREALAPDGSTIDPRGLGLGLYIVRNVVEAHAGRVELESVPGKGSTFTLYLPHKMEPK